MQPLLHNDGMRQGGDTMRATGGAPLATGEPTIARLGREQPPALSATLGSDGLLSVTLITAFRVTAE